MYEMSTYVFCIHMFIIHNYDVINNYSIQHVAIKISLMAPFAHFARFLPIGQLGVINTMYIGRLVSTGLKKITLK